MAASDALLRVSVVYIARAGEIDEQPLSLAAGACVADALRASGLQARHPELDLVTMPIGIWGVLCRRDTALRDRDRVEVYRPLRVDPKEARRRRDRERRSAGASGKSAR